jgi:Carboxypeptidase regulatory-like domain
LIRAALAFLCLRALAQPPVCAVSGTVVDQNTKKPVVKARVFASGSSYSIWKVTDASGFFCFEHLEPMSYSILVQKARYLDREQSVVVKEEKLPPLKIAISAQTVIAGVVLSSDGERLPGASVTLLTRKRTSKGANAEKIEEGLTGPDGTFRFSALSQDTYYLSATPPVDHWQRMLTSPFLDSQGQAVGEIEMETFYSGALRLDDATPLTLKSGQQLVNLALTVKKVTARRLAGRIAASPSEPFLVLVDNAENSNDQVIPIRADGSFSRDGLAPSSYTLRLSDRGKTIAKRQVDLTDADATGITLEPIETIDVLMRFRTEHNGQAYRHRTDRPIFLVKEGFDGIVGYPQPDGAVEFKNVEPDIYSCDIPLEQKLYVKQVTVAGEIQAGNKIDLRTTKAAVIEIVFSSSVAQVEGHVVGPAAKDGTDHDELQHTTVIMVAEGAGGTEVSIAEQAIADQKDAFKFDRVAPGKYRLFAIQGFDEDGWGALALAKELAAKSVLIAVKESETKSVVIPVISSADWEAAVVKTGSSQ